MGDSKPRGLTEDERAQMRQWLANWKQAGPLLDEERTARLQALSDAEAVALALDLWQLARPNAGDNGEGLLLVTRALQKLGARWVSLASSAQQRTSSKRCGGHRQVHRQIGFR